MLKICIDIECEVPFYQQIETQIKQLIKSRQLKAGEQIPAVREMARWLKVNPSTVARAYYDLKMDGVVATSRRRGTIILGTNYNLTPSREHKDITPGISINPLREKKDNGANENGIASILTLHLAQWWVQRSG